MRLLKPIVIGKQAKCAIAPVATRQQPHPPASQLNRPPSDKETHQDIKQDKTRAMAVRTTQSQRVTKLRELIGAFVRRSLLHAPTSFCSHSLAACGWFRSLIVRDGILLMPSCYDALSAKLIERAGAYSIGGFRRDYVAAWTC